MERDGDHIPSATSGPYPIRAGNHVRPLVDGDPAFRRICETVEAAQHSIWITVAFLEREVQMPDGRGSFFDVLDRARERGLDVRVIFWRCPELEAVNPGEHFSGTEDERNWLRERGSKFLARWDRAAKLYCQHQKSWLVDAGQHGEVAFVGGINLGQSSVVSPGHPVLGNRSFYGDTELNASFWHGPTVRALREELLLEHTGRDTRAMDDRSALRMYRKVARENARRRAAGEAQDGLTFALDPATYAS